VAKGRSLYYKDLEHKTTQTAGVLNLNRKKWQKTYSQEPAVWEFVLWIEMLETNRVTKIFPPSLRKKKAWLRL
jgi:hypothetical protein